MIGPNVGLNWGTFLDKNALPINGESNTSILGASLGAIAEFEINRILSVRVEPSYIQKGTDTQYSWPFMLEDKDRFQYLQIPIELEAKLPVFPFTPHIFFGPNVGYLLSAREEDSDPFQEYSVKNGYKTLDFALDFGAGIEYSIAPPVMANLDVKSALTHK